MLISNAGDTDNKICLLVTKVNTLRVLDNADTCAQYLFLCALSAVRNSDTQKCGLKVRGHVLVWDAYMTKWFFHEDYDTSKPIADRETLLKRMESYIEDGRQEIGGGVYGKSITDACLGWEKSERLIYEIADWM